MQLFVSILLLWRHNNAICLTHFFFAIFAAFAALLIQVTFCPKLEPCFLCHLLVTFAAFAAA